jgi:hypothetical protein
MADPRRPKTEATIQLMNEIKQQDSPSAAETIPIVVISYRNKEICNVLANLRKSLSFHHPVIVANNSGDDPLFADLYRQAGLESHAMIFNCSNRWLLSLNHPGIQQILNHSPFFIISDDDIDFCRITFSRERYNSWADELLATIREHPHIGKLGISILSGIDSVRNTKEYKMRNSSPVKDAFGPIVNRPVDTTPAIYRCKLYYPANNRFSPRHNKLLRDDLLSCTLLTVEGESISNEEEHDHYKSRDYLAQKAICFALNGACLSSDHFSQTPLHALIFYRVVRPLAWFISVIDAITRIMIGKATRPWRASNCHQRMLKENYQPFAPHVEK